MDYKPHYSVMLKDIIEEVQCEGGVFADLTFGAGGHTLALAKIPGTQILSFDQDPDALKNGYKYLKKNGVKNVELVDSNFENFPNHADDYLRKVNRSNFDGIVMDLGVSSHHFDTGERGFSFRVDAPLDMRMNPRNGESAASIIANWSEEEIAEVILSLWRRKVITEDCEKNC